MKTEIVVYTGNHGTITSFQANPKKSFFKDIHKFGKLCEVFHSTEAFAFKVKREGAEAAALKRVAGWYGKKKTFGPFGDVMRFNRVRLGEEYLYALSFIGQAAFPKPGMVADLALFIRDARGQVYVVGVIRKEEPGKGEIALVGGFRGIQGCRFATVLETVMEEAFEEIGITIKVRKSVESLPLVDKNPHDVKVNIRYADKKQWQPKGVARFIGSFLTSKQEKISRTQKRAHETSAYALLLDLKEVNDEVMDRLFNAGDDAQAVVAKKVSEAHFPIEHHQLIFEKARELLNV